MPFTFKLAQRLARMRSTALVLTTAALAACEKPIQLTDPGSTATQLLIYPKNVSLRTNQTADFTVVALTTTGDTAPVSVTWSVTGGAMINTSTNGGKHVGQYKAGSDTGKVKVTAHGNPGGQTDTAVVTVTQVPVAAVTVSPSSASVQAGQAVQLAATLVDSTGSPLTGRTITWTSSNASIAAVSSSGLVSGVAAGSATITATSEGQSSTASITVANVPVASVSVSPTTASVAVGQTTQLAATLRDAAGNVLSGRVVSWTSSNPGVATVSPTGVVSGMVAGSATVTATSEGQSGAATVTVAAPPPPPPPPPPAPSTVTDLGVAGVTDSSATLSFTEVNDGTGLPASYDIRYAAGTISWGSASEVTRGSCATPVSGTTIGAKRTCTVLGLAASTAYGFQLVAFRGTLGVNAVFGALSNAVSATTAVDPPAPVATVTVSPASASIAVGGTQSFTATLRDASGNVLSGRAVTWTSSALSVATVSTGGLASALLAGTTTITATSEGKSGAASLTVTAAPPVGGSWPHEPSGLSLFTDYGFSDALPVTQADVAIPGGSGWKEIYNGAGNGSIVSDASAPQSPGSVLQYKYPVGWGGGESPATLYYGLPGASQFYMGLWWKPSSPWQGHSPSNVNKIAFLFPGSSGDIYIAMYGPPGGPYELRVLPEFSGLPINWYVPNVNHVNVALGQWHRIEWFMDKGAGILRWWLDGQLIGDYSGVPYPAAAFSEFKLSSTWGGVGDTKTETDYYWFDHIHLSGR